MFAQSTYPIDGLHGDGRSSPSLPIAVKSLGRSRPLPPHKVRTRKHHCQDQNPEFDARQLEDPNGRIAGKRDKAAGQLLKSNRVPTTPVWHARMTLFMAATSTPSFDSDSEMATSSDDKTKIVQWCADAAIAENFKWSAGGQSVSRRMKGIYRIEERQVLDRDGHVYYDFSNESPVVPRSQVEKRQIAGGKQRRRIGYGRTIELE